MLSYQVFLLSYFKFGERDVILHCYSQQQGYVSFFANGGFSTRHKIRSFLYPLNELEIQILPKNLRSELKNIKSIELISNVLQSQNNLQTHSLSFLISDFLNQILSKEIHHEAYYIEIKLLINEIEAKNNTAFLVFFLRILFHLGYCPENKEGLYLDLPSGVFEVLQGPNTLSQSLSSLWKQCILSDLSYNFQLDKETRTPFLESIFLYYSLHYPNFKKPKSYAILKEILG